MPLYDDETGALRVNVQGLVPLGGFPAPIAGDIPSNPSGNLSSTNVQDALNELDTEKASVSHTHGANTITNVPSGGVSSTDVQAALNELDTEKLAASSYTAADVLTKVKTVDGAASGLDADLLDGQHASEFQPIDSDLTAIAGLSTTAAGRSVLTYADPGVDEIIFWDDSASTLKGLTIGSGLSITDTTISATSGLTDEEIQDKVGAMFTGNTEYNIVVTYQDADGTIDVELSDNPTITGTMTAGAFTANAGNITINRNSDASAAYFTITGDAGYNKGVLLQTGSSSRFLLFQSSTAESGSNAGSDFVVYRYSDAGSYLGIPFWIQRSTGKLFFEVEPSVAGSNLSEYIADTTGAMFSSNTETGIAATYQDSDNTIDLEVTYQGLIFGLTLSNNGTDATNDIDIAAGIASDDTGVRAMKLTSTLVKRLDAAWAVGTNQGGLDTGSIANTTYHVWLIMRSDTGVVDALFSTSASSPTMPANYDYKRRIGSIRRVSSAIVGFSQDGDEFLLKVPVRDVNTTNPGTSAVTATLSVPTGIVVQANVSFHMYDPTPSANTLGLVTSLVQTDTVPGSGLYNAATITTDGTLDASESVQLQIRTNTSAQIRYRLSASPTDFVVELTTFGWVDTRGRFS